MGRCLVDAVDAPHHPQCRRWQVLVPSDAAHPPCPLPLSSTAICSSRSRLVAAVSSLQFPFHPASCLFSPRLSCIYLLLLLLLHRSLFLPFPLITPLPFKGLLSPRSLRPVLVTLLIRNRTSTPLPSRIVSRNRQFAAPDFATSTINPRKPAAIRTSSAPTQPIPSPNSRREKEGSSFALPDPLQQSASALHKKRRFVSP